MNFLARMGVSEDAFFSRPLPHLAVRRRMIAEGDERALAPIEAAAFAGAALLARRRSGAARIAARQLFEELYGLENVAIPRASNRSPVWPQGFVGSLAHDEAMGIAAIARSSDFAALGVDIEPNQALGADLVALVATPLEIRRYPPRVVESRLLFVIKEAVYKALHPLDGRFLEFQDVEVDLDTLTASTAHQRAGGLRFCVADQIAAVAFPA